MKKILLSMFAGVLFLGSAAAQDLLVHRNGEEQEVKVLEISDKEIKFKKWANQDGPTYTLSTNDIFMIKYADGSKDVFEVKPRAVEKQYAPQNTPPCRFE